MQITIYTLESGPVQRLITFGRNKVTLILGRNLDLGEACRLEMDTIEAREMAELLLAFAEFSTRRG